MTINLHDLINQTGYGKAEKVLRKAGKWRLTPADMLNQIPEEECSDTANEIIDDVIEALEGTE
jgi:hypothetical protein